MIVGSGRFRYRVNAELNQAITEFFGRIREEGAAIARPGFLAAWR
jgi:hypothetical protein